MEEIYSNALKIEREVAAIEKLGGKEKNCCARYPKTKVFFNVP